MVRRSKKREPAKWYKHLAVGISLLFLLGVTSVPPASTAIEHHAGAVSAIGYPTYRISIKDKEESNGIPYLKLVREYSDDYGLDFRFVLALMKQESQFDPLATSNRGAFGLMQIMPPTGTEISDKLDIQSIRTPGGNLNAGIFYFTEILRLFKGGDSESQLRLSLAAYYAGPARIYDAQDIAAYMGENPTSWSSVKSALPLLSKRFYSLHRSVWEGGKPRKGYFGHWRQTLAYVNNVMENYKVYQLEFE